MRRADKDDWVIRGVNGEIYPCKPDIFEKTYEAVAEDEDDEFSKAGINPIPAGGNTVTNDDVNAIRDELGI